MQIQSVAKFLLPVLLLGAGIGGFNYLKSTRPEQPQPQPSEKVWQVKTQTAEPQTRAPVINLYGQVEAPRELSAAAPGNAVVAEVAVREGDLVDAGQLLIRLDARDFAPQVTQAQAEVAELQAGIQQRMLQHENDLRALQQELELLDLARSAVARAERLQRQQLGPESALDQAREALVRQRLALANRQLAVDSHPAILAERQARLSRARASLEQAQRDLQRSQVRTTFKGVVAAVNVSAGDRVAPGTVLVTLYALDELEIRARIPERYQAEIQSAIAADQRRLPASATLAGTAIKLYLDRLAGAADPSGIDGLFRLASPSVILRPGNLLAVQLQRPAQDSLIAVPLQAVYGNSRLYLLEDGRLRGIDVESVGRISGDNGDNRLLVRSAALTAGAEIVVTHLPNAVDGLKVTTRP